VDARGRRSLGTVSGREWWTLYPGRSGCVDILLTLWGMFGALALSLSLAVVAPQDDQDGVELVEVVACSLSLGIVSGRAWAPLRGYNASAATCPASVAFIPLYRARFYAAR